MTLLDLAAQYREECAKIQKQITKQKCILKALPPQSVRRIDVERRILILEDMLRDTSIIADHLEHYYEKE